MSFNSSAPAAAPQAGAPDAAGTPFLAPALLPFLAPSSQPLAAPSPSPTQPSEIISQGCNSTGISGVVCVNNIVSDNQIVTAMYYTAGIGIFFLIVFGTFRAKIATYKTRTLLPQIHIKPPPLPEGGIQQLWSWMSPVLWMEDGDLMNTAGLDSLMMSWANSLGIQIFLPMSILACIMLLPINVTADRVAAVTVSGTANTDRFMKLTVSNVPKGSGLLWFNVLFVYIFVGWSCWLLIRYYKAYVVLRQRYLTGGDEFANDWHNGFLGTKLTHTRSLNRKPSMMTAVRRILDPAGGAMEAIREDSQLSLGGGLATAAVRRRLTSTGGSRAGSRAGSFSSSQHGSRPRLKRHSTRRGGDVSSSGALESVAEGPQEGSKSPGQLLRHSTGADTAHLTGPVVVSKAIGRLSTSSLEPISTPEKTPASSAPPSPHLTAELLHSHTKATSSEPLPQHRSMDPSVPHSSPYPTAAAAAAHAHHSILSGRSPSPRKKGGSVHFGENQEGSERLLEPASDSDAGREEPPTGGAPGPSEAGFAGGSQPSGSSPTRGGAAPGPQLKRLAGGHHRPDGGSPERGVPAAGNFDRSRRNTTEGREPVLMRASRISARDEAMSAHSSWGVHSNASTVVAPQAQVISLYESEPNPYVRPLMDPVMPAPVVRWWDGLEAEAEAAPSKSNEQARPSGVGGAGGSAKPLEKGNSRMVAKPSVRFRKTVNTYDILGKPMSVNAQQYAVLVMDVPHGEPPSFWPWEWEWGWGLPRWRGWGGPRSTHSRMASEDLELSSGSEDKPELMSPDSVVIAFGDSFLPPPTPMEELPRPTAQIPARPRSSAGGMSTPQDPPETSSGPPSLAGSRAGQGRAGGSVAGGSGRGPVAEAQEGGSDGSRHSGEGQPPVISPKDVDDMSPEELVTATFRNLFPDTFHQVVAVRKHREVDLLLKDWDLAFGRLEAAEARYDGKSAQRPREKQGWCGCTGREVDSIDWWAARVRQLELQIHEARQDCLKAPPTGSFFVLFTSQKDAAIAAQTNLHPEDNHAFKVVEAPGPEEVLWTTLWMPWRERDVREFLILPLLGLFLLLPIGLFSGAVAQATVAICGTGGTAGRNPLYLSWYCSGRSYARSLVTTFLPPLLLMLWQNLIMPNALYRIALAEAQSVSLSQLDRRISSLFFAWDAGNVFLGAMLGGSIFSQLGRLIKKPGDLFSVVGTALPASSNFFVNFVITQAFAWLPFRFMFPHIGVLVNLFRLTGRGVPRTPRAKAAALWPHSIRYGRELGVIMLIYLIACAYAATSPIILPFALAYFVISWFYWRYTMIYVNERCYESGGRVWDQVFKQVLACLFILELFTACVLLANEAFLQAVVLALTVTPILHKFRTYCKVRFEVAVAHVPLETAAAAPAARVDPAVYTPPALRKGATGWYPEYGKAWENWGAPVYTYTL